MDNTNKSFEGYIPNFDAEVGLVTLNQLQSAILNDPPCVINFFTKDKTDVPASVSLQEAEKDKGGLGKTVLLERSRNFVYANRFPQANVLGEGRKWLPTIELAEQYITKQAILLQIVERLCNINNDLRPIFDTFTRRVSALTGTLNSDYDPSFIAEKLFDEATQPYTNTQNTGGGAINPFADPNGLIIFIDAFDAQYVGAKNAPFRKWLLDVLFPYLIGELNIKVVIAGRGKVDIDPKFGIINKEFSVKSFSPKDLAKYFASYINRIDGKPNPVSDAQKNRWKELSNELKNNKEILTYVYECTDGKPIFIDYFADLVYQLCIIHENQYANLTAFVRKIKMHSLESGFSKANEGEGFRKYIMDGLYYRQQNNDEQLLLETIKGVQVLSLFQHGLNAQDLAELVETVKIKGKPNSVLKTAQEVETFFTFFQSANLSYVKDRKAYPAEYPPSIRLLHDETVFLFRKYYNDYDDPTHDERDAYIGYMLRMYERKLALKDQMPVAEYNKKLLEYLEYSFTIYKKGKEQDAINRLLFEFSYYLDRHPDLCSRILEKGLNYYSYKRQLFKDNKEVYPDLTLTFSKDFALLVKLKFREVEYCLTERSKANDARIEDIIKKIRQHVADPKIVLTDLQKNSIEARCLVSEGELFFWQGQWDKGRELVVQAREKFYKTGDSQGVTWSEHLLGFEAQRSGQFQLAAKHHKDAIENALVTFPQMEKVLLQRQVFGLKDYALLYRLRFLLRTISRANGNWGVNLRYRGKVLEAIKLLETNAEIAQEVGMRELVRVGSNIAQYNAIRGIESDFLQAYFEGLLGSLKLSDSALERRLALTRTVFIGKQLAAESDVYTRNATDFAALKPKTMVDFLTAQNSVEQIDKEVEDIEQLDSKAEEAEDTEGEDNPLIYLKKRIPSKRLFLSVGKNKDMTTFQVTHLLAEDLAYRDKWIGKPNREIADMYYQYGKLVLSTKFFDEKADYFEEARLAFENARYCANIATFKYLEMEALEALYRLCYLANDPKHRAMKVAYQADFKALRDETGEKEADYGTYFDLLAKFELTEGDFRLDEILLLPFTKLTLWHSAFSHYALALNYAHQHNQERYLLILEALADRIRTVLRSAKTVEAIQSTENWLMGFFKAQAIFKEDSTFGLHLKTLLAAARLEMLKQFDTRKAIYDVRLDIRELARKGKFIKAAQANNSLIQLFKPQTAYKSQLATRYFQQFYFYLGATQRGRVNKLLEQMKMGFNLTDTEGGQCESFEEAVFYLMRGTADYRTDEFWNMEKFIYGELTYFKIKFGRKLIGQAKTKPSNVECIKAAMAKFESAETKIIKSIKYFKTHTFNASETRIAKKLIAEGLFRLGELYILMELKQGERDDLENYLDEYIVTKNMYDVLSDKQTNSNSKIYKRSPSVHLLNCAYYFAKHIGDKLREIDAWQSIANARYFLGQTVEKDNSTEEEKETINKNIHRIIDKTHKKLREEAAQIDIANNSMFPIVVAKSYLVEGDIYFSCLFEIDQTLIDTTNRIHFKLRSFWKDGLEDWQTQEKIKSILHEMLWAYLKGLDLLTDSDKVYENYHFNNMAYEINRRIRLIQERDLVRMLFEDLKPIWDNFNRLERKDNAETWDSLTYAMRVHELALAANAIFNQQK